MADEEGGDKKDQDELSPLARRKLEADNAGGDGVKVGKPKVATARTRRPRSAKKATARKVATKKK